MALVVLTNINHNAFHSKKEVKTPKEIRKEIVVAKGFKTEFSISKKLSTLNNATAVKSKMLFLRNFPKTTVNKTTEVDEPIEVVSKTKMDKTADELIAEDNLITENNISNETQPLDFYIIDGNEVVESNTTFKTEKTADQLFAEDNLITENNISNETQSLDFEIINKSAKLGN
jgi:hypothetical protein